MHRKLVFSISAAAALLVLTICLFIYLFLAGRNADDPFDRRARVASFFAWLLGAAVIVKFAWDAWRRAVEDHKQAAGAPDQLECEVKWDAHPFPEGRLALSLYNGNDQPVSVREITLRCTRMEKPEVLAELKAFCRVDPPEPGAAGLVTSRWQGSFVIEPHHPTSVFLQPCEVTALFPIIAEAPEECTYIEIATHGGYREVITGEQIKPIVNVVLSKLAKKA